MTPVLSLALSWEQFLVFRGCSNLPQFPHSLPCVVRGLGHPASLTGNPAEGQLPGLPCWPVSCTKKVARCGVGGPGTGLVFILLLLSCRSLTLDRIRAPAGAESRRHRFSSTLTLLFS